jgi:Fe-S-cluster containining protein
MRPCLEPELTLRPDEDHLRVERGGVSVRLSRAQVTAVFLADGRRAVRDIVSVLWALDLAVDPRDVQAAFAALAQAGLVSDVDPRRLPQRVLAGTTHRCQACGRSCQSQRVGALTPPEVERIESIWPALQAVEPTLSGFSPFRRERGGIYLERVDSQCLFLDRANQCMIHHHFGADYKPNMCQMYPFVRVLTETGTRLAVAPGCTRAHTRVEPSADGQELAALPADTFDREVAVSHPLSLHGRFPLRRAFDLWEKRLLALLDSPEASVAGVAEFLVPDHGPAVDASFAPSIPERLRASGLTPVAMPRHSLGKLWFGLLTAEPTWPPRFDDARRAVLLRTLRDTVWARDTILFDTPLEAVAAVLAGFVLACSMPGFDAFGESLSAWVRLLHTGARDHLFVNEGEVRALWRAARTWHTQPLGDD